MNYITFEEICDRQCGRVILANGCAYFIDMDDDLAYYRQMDNGMFEDHAEYPDMDCLSEDEKKLLWNIQCSIGSDLPITDAF